MYWLISLIGAALVGALLVVLVDRIFGRQEQLPGLDDPEVRHQHWENLRHNPLTADAIRGVKFSLSPRGYNMAEVDAFLKRLADHAEGNQQTPSEPGTVETHSEQPNIPAED